MRSYVADSLLVIRRSGLTRPVLTLKTTALVLA